MESTASIPETEAWTLRVSSKHPGKYPERCLRQGQKLEKRSFVLCLLSCSAGFAGACGSGARCRRPFLPSFLPLLGPVWWVLSGVVFQARFLLCFARQGDDPRTNLWQVSSLYGGGIGLQHCVFVGYDYVLHGGARDAQLLRIAYFLRKPPFGEQYVLASYTQRMSAICTGVVGHQLVSHISRAFTNFFSISRSRTEAWRRTLVTR